MDAQNERDACDRDRAGCRERCRQHDESRTGHAGRSLGGHEQDQQQSDLLTEIEWRIGRLRQEHGGRGQIETGAVEVERIAGGYDEANHAFLASQIFELGDHARQHRFGRRRRDADQQLFPDVADQLHQANSTKPRDRTKGNNHKDDACEIKPCEQLAERGERPDAELPNRERNAAKCPDRRRPHHDRHNGKDHLGADIDGVDERLGPIAQLHQRETANNRDKEHLQDIAFRKGPDKRAGNDVHQERHETDGGGLLDIRLHRAGVDGGRVDVHPDAWLQ